MIPKNHNQALYNQFRPKSSDRTRQHLTGTLTHYEVTGDGGHLREGDGTVGQRQVGGITTDVSSRVVLTSQP